MATNGNPGEPSLNPSAEARGARQPNLAAQGRKRLDSGKTVMAANPFAGRRLIKRDGSAAAPGALDGKVTLLYFSASWCPPCHRFTPVLADFYDDVKQMGGNIEIVYVPGDRSKGEMMEYFQNEHADYLALDLGEKAFIQELNQRYSVRGIPSVVVIQPDGTAIDTDGRSAVQNRGPAAFEQWKVQWQGSAFGAGAGNTLGGGGGVSRLLQQQPAAAAAAGTGGYDEEAAFAAALMASMAPAPAPAPASVALTRTRSDEERSRRSAAEVAEQLSGADSAVAEAELAVTNLEIQFTRVDAAIAALEENNTAGIVRTAVELLVKILVRRPKIFYLDSLKFYSFLSFLADSKEIVGLSRGTWPRTRPTQSIAESGRTTSRFPAKCWSAGELSRCCWLSGSSRWASSW